MLYTLENNSDVLRTNKSPIELINSLLGKKFKLLATETDNHNIKSIDEFAESNPRRSFIALQFDLSDLDNVRQAIKVDLGNPTHFIYRMNETRGRIVIETNRLLGRYNYSNIIKSLASQFGIKISNAYTKIIKPLIFQKITKDDIVENVKTQPLVITDDAFQDPDRLVPDQKRMMRATQDFLKKPETIGMLHNQQKATKIFDSLAASYLSHMLTRSYIHKILQIVSKVTNYEISSWENLFKERIELLKANPDLRENVPAFGDLIHLDTQASSATNLAQQLKALIPGNAQPNPDYDLSEACNFIEMACPPHLLEQQGTDVDNVVIFDSTQGIWTHDRDVWYSLLTAIRPYSNEQQFKTFQATFAAKARNANRFIHPYSGSRYILFEDCMLDVKTMKTYNLNDDLVRKLHFSDRSKLHIPYAENPKLPILKGERVYKNGDWNPRDWLMTYADNDHEKYMYLLFGLALGLFGGHNFGVHFDIQGDSRFGKTILATIYRNCYGNGQVMIIPFANLNSQFAFTSYPLNTSLIWVNESNVGSEPLNETYGTPMYDQLAENLARFQVKNKGDMVVSNPPQVYIDGTQFIKAKDLYTGPAGRTLAFKLPTTTEDLRHQSYAFSIYDDLARTDVLQWIVYNALQAYREFVPAERIDDLQLNMATQSDQSLFPPVALQWRKEFVMGGSTIDDWFTDEIEPFLSTDPKNPTYLHSRVIYSLFLNAYKLANPNDNNGRNAKTVSDVMNRLRTIWENNDDKFEVNYEVGSKEAGRAKVRKRIASPDKMNFDWDAWDQEYQRPHNLESPGFDELQLFGKKTDGWISIYRKTDSTDSANKD